MYMRVFQSVQKKILSNIFKILYPVNICFTVSFQELQQGRRVLMLQTLLLQDVISFSILQFHNTEILVHCHLLFKNGLLLIQYNVKHY